MVKCGVVLYDMVWCVVVWNGVVWCRVVWCSVELLRPLTHPFNAIPFRVIIRAAHTAFADFSPRFTSTVPVIKIGTIEEEEEEVEDEEEEEEDKVEAASVTSRKHTSFKQL